MSTLTDDCIELRRLRIVKDEAKAAWEEAKRDFEIAEAKLLERMDEEKCQGQRAEGINFGPTRTIYAVLQDRSTFIEWAEQNDVSLVELRERKALLNELVREKLDNGEPLPPGLGFRVDEGISQRAA